MLPRRAVDNESPACGSREVALWLFVKRAEADAWIDGEGVSVVSCWQRLVRVSKLLGYGRGR
jgi:hypothetical protein